MIPPHSALAALKKRARQTVATVENALDSNQTTAIAEIIQIIQTLANRAFQISVPELSQLIGRDPTITAKVISAANTLGYNPHATPILTISQGIHTIGFEKVRNLAISLMLAQNSGLARNTYEQREMTALAVCSGLLAQALLAEKEDSIDEDLAFVCASLRNYGKLLMATFMVDDFRVARSLVQRTGDESAYLEVFGLSPLSLGLEILQQSNLPKAILLALRAVGADTIHRAPATPSEQALVLAELCGRICETAFNDRVGPEAFNAAILEVVSQFSRSFPVTVETVNLALLAVETQLSQLNKVVGIPDDRSPGTLKLRARSLGENLPAPPQGATLQLRGIAANPLAGPTRDETAESSFHHAIETIEDQIASREKIDLRSVYELAAQALRDSLGLDNCLAFLPEESEKGKFSARFGCGRLFDKVKNRPIVAAANRDIFSICLARKEDILIQDAKAGKVVSIVPEWIHADGHSLSFIILPVIAGQQLFSIILGSTLGERVIKPDEHDLRRPRALKAELAKVHRLLFAKQLTAV